MRSFPVYVLDHKGASKIRYRSGDLEFDAGHDAPAPFYCRHREGRPRESIEGEPVSPWHGTLETVAGPQVVRRWVGWLEKR
jgi:hypothetical protein